MLERAEAEIASLRLTYVDPIYQSKLLGFKKPDSEEERQALRLHYRGQVESCCECGIEYPRGDLVIDSEIYCQACRPKPREKIDELNEAHLGGVGQVRQP